MRKTINGFTIVELLVVIVVIGILASIVIVTYNGIQQEARNTARYTELKDWQKLFQKYKSQFGTYPDFPSGNDYCLGTNFPIGYNNERRCRNYTISGSTSYKESDNAALMTELKKAGSPPTVTGDHIPVAGLVGPFVDVWGKDWGGQISGVFEGGADDCPKDTQYSGWNSGGAVICWVQI